MKVNWNLVVDVVVALVGVYVLMNGIWMKSTGKTSSLLATPEELKKCKHPEKIREEVTPKMLLCLYNECTKDLREMLLLLAILLLFRR